MSLSFIYGDKLRDIANRSETSKEDVTLNYIVSQLFALIINNPSRGRSMDNKIIHLGYKPTSVR